MQGKSSKPVPAALKPTPKPEKFPDIHIAFIVPDERLQKLLVNRTYILQPPFIRNNVIVHAISEQWMKDTEMMENTGELRQALLELGMVDPEEVEFKPVKMTLGWESDE